MEAIMFIGLQGSGKSSFYAQRFLHSHVRVSLDLMKIRHRQGKFLQTCLATGQRFVVDNTNPTAAERRQYIEAAKVARYFVKGYYFCSKVEECLSRNAQRPPDRRVPDVAIFATAKVLERPSFAEGFDELYYVQLQEGEFRVEPWSDAD